MDRNPRILKGFQGVWTNVERHQGTWGDSEGFWGSLGAFFGSFGSPWPLYSEVSLGIPYLLPYLVARTPALVSKRRVAKP